MLGVVVCVICREKCGCHLSSEQLDTRWYLFLKHKRSTLHKTVLGILLGSVCNMQRKVWLPSVSRTDGHQTPPCCCCSSCCCCNTPNFPARLLLCCFNPRENIKPDQVFGRSGNVCRWCQKFLFLFLRLEYGVTILQYPPISSLILTFVYIPRHQTRGRKSFGWKVFNEVVYFVWLPPLSWCWWWFHH